MLPPNHTMLTDDRGEGLLDGPKKKTLQQKLKHQVYHGSYCWANADDLMIKAANKIILLERQNKKLLKIVALCIKK